MCRQKYMGRHTGYIYIYMGRHTGYIYNIYIYG